jgi:hypothetical protein
MPTPDPNDDILDNVIEIDEDSGIGEENMPTELPEALAIQNLGRLAQAGLQAHEHFVQFGKVLDLSYEQDRKMVSLVESLGVREVTSASGQAGIPASAR